MTQEKNPEGDLWAPKSGTRAQPACALSGRGPRREARECLEDSVLCSHTSVMSLSQAVSRGPVMAGPLRQMSQAWSPLVALCESDCQGSTAPRGTEPAAKAQCARGRGRVLLSAGCSFSNDHCARPGHRQGAGGLHGAAGSWARPECSIGSPAFSGRAVEGSILSRSQNLSLLTTCLLAITPARLYPHSH